MLEGPRRPGKKGPRDYGTSPPETCPKYRGKRRPEHLPHELEYAQKLQGREPAKGSEGTRYACARGLADVVTSED